MNDITETSVDLSAQYQIIPDDQRMKFLPRQYGRQMITFENLLFTVAKKTIKGYQGGYWEYATDTQGLGFAFPKTNCDLTVSTIFGTGASKIPPEIAGILCTALATLIMVEKADELGLSDTQSDAYVDRYYDLIHFGRNLATAANVEREYFELTD